MMVPAWINNTTPSGYNKIGLCNDAMEGRKEIKKAGHNIVSCEYPWIKDWQIKHNIHWTGQIISPTTNNIICDKGDQRQTVRSDTSHTTPVTGSGTACTICCSSNLTLKSMLTANDSVVISFFVFFSHNFCRI